MDRNDTPSGETASTAPGPGLFRFSTASLPQRDRVATWREQFGRRVLGVDFEPLPDAPVCADLTMRALPGLGIGSGTISAARHARTRALLADGNSDLYLVLPKASTGSVRQRGREFAFGKGDAVLINGGEVSTFVSAGTMGFLNVRIPHAKLAPLVGDLGDAMRRPIPARTEALRLLADYLAALSGDNAPAGLGLQRLAVAHVLDLVALALGATREAAAVAESRGLGVARLAAIKADITANLAHETLSVGAIAARHCLTPRSVQRLFEAEGLTFSEFLRDERLARAWRWLTDPHRAHLTVTTIAYAVGFSDLSYFHRSFRRRYGATPAEVRNEAPPLAPGDQTSARPL